MFLCFSFSLSSVNVSLGEDCLKKSLTVDSKYMALHRSEKLDHRQPFYVLHLCSK